MFKIRHVITGFKKSNFKDEIVRDILLKSTVTNDFKKDYLEFIEKYPIDLNSSECLIKEKIFNINLKN